jgi:hypothetical protein
MAKGILIAAMDFSPVAEDEFHDWYDLEHVPERERVPGFLDCRRWIGAQNPKISVATYELDNVEVLQSAAYRAIGGENLSPWSKRITGRVNMLMRYEGEQILPGDGAAPAEAEALLVNAMSVAPEHEHEFNEWYNAEHIPALAAVPGTLCARRYRGSVGLQPTGPSRGAAQKYVAVYHLASVEVQASAAWKAAANTPWTERMRPHFRDHLRIVARRYARLG